MRKRKQEAILHTRRYKIHAEPEKILPIQSCFCIIHGNNEDDIISAFTIHHESHMRKQDIIHKNAKQIQ